MLFEIFKLFTDEQDKLTKLIYSILKILLSLALMFFLYDWVLERTISEDLININLWMELLRKGYLLIMIFLFFISYVFLFTILDIIIFWGVIFFAETPKLLRKLNSYLLAKLRKKEKNTEEGKALAKGIADALLKFQIIHKTNPNQRGIAGKNFDRFYEIFFEFMENDKNGKLPNVNQLLLMLFAFAFIYQIYDINTVNRFVGIILYILIITLIVSGIIINRIMGVLRENHADIAAVLNFLATEKILLQLMQRVGFKEISPSKLEDNTTTTGNLFTKFNYLGKDYIVFIYYSEASIKRPYVLQAIKISEEMSDCHLLFIVSAELSVKGKEVWDNYSKTDKTLIQFNDEEDLIEKFVTEFE